MEFKKIRHEFNNPDMTMFQAVLESSVRTPDAVSMSFYGKNYSYKTLIAYIEKTARALVAKGVSKEDAVTCMLPNIPQAIAVFYAINRIGAVANMIHTLSSEEEIAYYLQKARSRYIITLDTFAEKVGSAVGSIPQEVTVIYTKAGEQLPLIKKIGFILKTLKKGGKRPDVSGAYRLEDLIKASGDTALPEPEYSSGKTAVILYSGGSTGFPKGICLSDKNFNAASLHLADACGMLLGSGVKFLSAMPLFHGFGLCVGIHTFLSHGAQCVLVPVFSTDAYVSTLLKDKPDMMAIVPSMLEALLHIDKFEGKDLSFLKGVFCGADVAPIQLQERVNRFLSAHGCDRMVREGYGLTETVTACIWNPPDKVIPGSVGIPLGDTKCRIVKPGTFEDLPQGKEGELILNGSVVMLGYLDDPEETSKTLRTDVDGRTWLFTGDMCKIGNDDYVYFVQRIKRIIITSGFNVTPAQVERVINDDINVDKCCVVGQKDKLLGQKVVAVVVLKEYEDQTNARKRIIDECRKRLSDYAVPTKVVFKDDLPLTKMGKIDVPLIENELNKELRG